jgi:lactate dehydrogenase-like 2-hydroxyacid dehydrogenase
VADVAIYLIISTFRLLSKSALDARSLDPKRFQETQHGLSWCTVNPSGHTLGIIGLGRIGQRIAQKAHACFPMKIVYNDVRRLPESVERETDAKFYENVEDMLSISDCAVVATPFGGSKVLDAEKISKMKQGSRLVNIARGKLVDEDALIGALEKGQLQSAGLDVHYDEPNVNPKLAAMENVEVLCHNGGTTLNSQMGFETIGMENILSFFETGKALTPVNLHFFDNSSS